MQGQFGAGGPGSYLNQQRTGWQQQPMQPMQTGYNPMMGMGMGMMGSQPTGFQPQQQQQSSMMSQPTGAQGFGGGMSSMRQQPSGMGGGRGGGGSNYSFLSQPPPSRFGGGGSGLTSQPTGFPGGMMTSQPTGFAGGGASGLMPQLTAQPTGMMPHDPRLQMMAASFMPSNVSQPFTSSGAMSFAHPTSQPLPETFNSLLSNPKVATPKVPWTLSRQEKKDYDQIFRAWTGGDGGGFIEGAMAQEVFGQSGLPRESLGKIWNLADVNDRGKLNLPEFHVAMGLIYRALNGNDIPEELPSEMMPPSMRDIDSTVDFVKGLLKNDTSSRSTPDISLPGTYASTGGNGNGASAGSNYKHDDSRTKAYRSSNRHIDRAQVRYDGEDSSAELERIKRDLANSSTALDRSAAEFASRTEEDERLEAELDELKYRVRRVKDDIDYVSRGKRTEEKDEERRKLERELLHLMHERLPDVERKIEQREERKRQEARDGIRARDRRNETYGRYDGGGDSGDRYRGSDYSSSRRYDDDERYRRDRDDEDRERRRRRDEEEDRSRYARRPDSPPPAPPAEAPRSAVSAPPPAPPAPTSNATAAPSTKSMTPEERSAFIRKQAQERLAARMKALGMAPPEEQATPAVDNSVADRLERERKEAEEKSKAAEKQQEEREAARKARLQQAGGGGGKDEPKSSPAAAPAPPTPKSAMKKSAPPPPKPRQAAVPPPAAPATIAAPKQADSEDDELRRQEEAHEKAMAERKARLQRMREEEEEAQRAEEEMIRKRQEARQQKESSAEKTREVVQSPPASNTGSTNPFHRLQGAGAVSSPPATTASSGTSGGFNPFLRPKAGAAASPSPAPAPAAPSPAAVEEDSSADAPPPPPPPPPPPAPAFEAPSARSVTGPSSAAPASRPAFAPADEEWDVIGEKEDDSDSDSSDDDYAGSRSKRGALAAALFGGGGSKPSSSPSTPPPPAASKAALAKLGGSAGADPNSRGALFASIQSGARLKKAVTNDRSGVQGVGQVLGDAAAPDHIKSQPREIEAVAPPTNPPAPESEANGDAADQKALNRQSVDWYGSLAADADRSHHNEPAHQPMPAVSEDTEESASAHDDMGDFDVDTSLRVRTLFAFEAQRDIELSFAENIVLIAHPAKDASSAWWYGTTLAEGKKGWFPSNYVQEMHPTPAKALFPYTGNSAEELPFEEGDVLSIVDHAEDDWWKAEKDGVIFIVPAAYLELTVETVHPQAPEVKVSLAAPDEDAVSDASSEDSALSFDDDDDEDDEAATRREEARLRVMQAAGLQLRREPPGVPPARTREVRRRRAPPPAPISRQSRAHSFAESTSPSILSSGPPSPRPTDAYDRYQEMLEKAATVPNRARAHSDVRKPRPASSISLSATSDAAGLSSTPPTTSRLTGFMSRMLQQTPTTPERKMPSISGPMTVATEDDLDAAESPGVSGGPTWSSLVDRSVLETMSDRERKRQEAIFELIATEGAYVRDLQLIVEVFYRGLLDLLDNQALEGIFGNIEDILLFNTTLLSSLEDRQKSSRLYIDQIGDILADQLPAVTVYERYCVNQGAAIKSLQQIRIGQPHIAEKLADIRQNDASVRNLDLSSFLLEPMQRLTRYPLLLRQILHYTDDSDDTINVQKALDSAEFVVSNVNDAVRQSEDTERLRALSDDLWIGGEGRLDLTAPTAFQGPRRLLKQGTVTKAKSGRRLEMLLCSDIIVLIETHATSGGHSLYRMPIPLHEASAKEAAGRGDGFQVTQQFRRGGDAISLRAASAREAQKWIRSINDAREVAIKARLGRSTSVGDVVAR